MADILSKDERSRLMSRVRTKNTLPELTLRRALHRLGFRYRLHPSKLPGKPDLVFPSRRAVVFVHGCFWHRHHGCKAASTPKTNVDFWQKKLVENEERDRRTIQLLEDRAYHVLVVWECELTSDPDRTITRVANWLTTLS